VVGLVAVVVARVVGTVVSRRARARRDRGRWKSGDRVCDFSRAAEEEDEIAVEEECEGQGWWWGGR
jgi:hypothetical protein